MEKRPYRQTRRAEATEATRQRILAAARDQLVSGEDFTIEAVADCAGVSRVTVYAQFGSRDALREAVYDHLAATGGLDATPSIFAEPDPIQGIDRLIDIFCGFYTTHRFVLRRLNALAALAAGDGDRPPDRNRRRRHILTVLLSHVAQLPAYRGLDVESAAGVLQALTSFEFYDRLADETTEDETVRCIRQLALVALRPQ
ncbi:MAG: TetR/AcrR family transcriptional regulator [Chloroflexi bacterium]|nr:TetR/AcrR family transcriptional regulator [Chloroflexota bacterium]